MDKWRIATWIAGIYIVVAASGHGYRWYSSSTSGQTPNTTAFRNQTAVTGDLATVKFNFPACRSQETARSLLQMLVAEDNEALLKAMTLQKQRGECTMLVKGDAVFVTELAIWMGLARVRLKGETDELWFDSGFIEKVQAGK